MNRLRLDETLAARSRAEGGRMHDLVRELFPLTRSITGPGLRATVQRLADMVPLEITEVPSGTRVFDWTIPDEWSIEEAFLEHESGQRFADLEWTNLHVLGYSTPVDGMFDLAELQPHLFSLADDPDAIPFRTSFYSPNWGFCLTDRQRQSLPEGRYRALIRSELRPGSLTLAEYLHRGESEEEVLVFAHDCHPSQANDNLSGVAVAIHLAAFLSRQTTRYSYRFVFAPATIGTIAWIATNERRLARIRHGLVLSLLGHDAPLQYKKTRTGSLPLDRAAWHVLQGEFAGAGLVDFSPWGHDERQFASPGIDSPVGLITRAPDAVFPGSHTSNDTPDIVTGDALAEAWVACLKIFEALEADTSYVNLQPKGEPQLGRRGLYRNTGGHYTGMADRQMALLWMLNQSDGSNSVIDIAEKSRLPIATLAAAADDLEAVELLERVDVMDRRVAGAPAGDRVAVGRSDG
jgi:aminopeptidase-like protein